jgi:hypothetical protein
VWYLAQVAELSEKLDRAIAGDSRPGPKEDLSQLGPASTGVYRAVPLGEGRVRFDAIAPSSFAASIEFERVDSAPGSGVDRPFYLARTELSVAQAIGIIRARKLDDAWRELSPPVDAQDDAREGLRTWEWTLAPSPFPRVSSTWLGASGSAVSAPIYPSGGAPKPPTSASPMQQIAPAEALLIVSGLGCRLPSAAEWSAAEASSPDKSQPNVRDAAWRRQQEHVEQQASRGAYLPASDLGAFDSGAASSASSAAEVDDGVLWLSPVDNVAGARPRERGFVHLLGNVMEYVLDSGVEDAPLSIASAQDVKDAAVTIGERWRVVGGSAQSPPSLDPRQPRAIPADKRHAGFADVGLRPAFTAPGPGRARTLSQRIEHLLDPLPILERR